MNATPLPITLSCIYVHLISGSIEELSPADAVLIGPETVEVLNAGLHVARFTAREVLFCSHLDVSPFPMS